jgi:hypothetical protein
MKLIDQTILQEASGNTMQKLILCSMIFFLGIGQAYAADEAEEAAPKSSAYVSLGDPMVLNLSGGKRLTSRAGDSSQPDHAVERAKCKRYQVTGQARRDSPAGDRPRQGIDRRPVGKPGCQRRFVFKYSSPVGFKGDSLEWHLLKADLASLQAKRSNLQIACCH